MTEKQRDQRYDMTEKHLRLNTHKRTVGKLFASMIPILSTCSPVTPIHNRSYSYKIGYNKHNLTTLCPPATFIKKYLPASCNLRGGSYRVALSLQLDLFLSFLFFFFFFYSTKQAILIH